MRGAQLCDCPLDARQVPEEDIFEALHVLRRKLVTWLRQRASQGQLDHVMDAVLRVSASTGSLTAESDELAGWWAFVGGDASVGRFARHSIRSVGGAGPAGGEPNDTATLAATPTA